MLDTVSNLVFSQEDLLDINQTGDMICKVGHFGDSCIDRKTVNVNTKFNTLLYTC